MIKKIVLQNVNNEKISGILKEKNAASPLIVVCHGFNSSHNHPAIESITDKLYTMGYSTFSFNFSKSASGFNLREQVSDIMDIVRYFNNREIILLAASFGALSSILAALNSSKIKGLITVNGFFGNIQLKGETLFRYIIFRLLTPFQRSYRNTWKYFVNNFKLESISCSTLVIHSQHDEQVMFAQSERFFKKLKGKKHLHVLKKADHHLTQEGYRQETAAIIDLWLKKYPILSCVI